MDEVGPKRDLPDLDGTTERVVKRRPEGVCAPRFGDIALKLFDMGYEPVPIRRGEKRPAVSAWTAMRIDGPQVEAWVDAFASCGVGLRTGQLIAVDIDILDPDLAHQAEQITRMRLGPTLTRVGLWPKRLLLYRTLRPMAKLRVGKIEVLGQGQQFVAFGIHPDTGRPYGWPSGDSPLDTVLDSLPLVIEGQIEALLAELEVIAGPAPSGSRTPKGEKAKGHSRNASGMVSDGRDGWLSTIAFHEVHDSLDRDEALDEGRLATAAWQRFTDTTDLSRPRKDAGRPYGLSDARAKVAAKLRLWRDGLLPQRAAAVLGEAPLRPQIGVGEARTAIDAFMEEVMVAFLAWHEAGRSYPAPRFGLQATVGLGKSTAARRHLSDLIARLAALGLPHRLVNFVPSLSLADETAAAWRYLGHKAVVLRGYDAKDPITEEPVCRDIEAVKAAAAAELVIQSSVCVKSRFQRCPHFVSCPKQKNRRDVAEADIVVLAHDAMFTGFAGDHEFALAIVDEACWSRSTEVVKGLTVDALPLLGVTGVAGTRWQDQKAAEVADLVAMREKLSKALVEQPEGEVKRGGLLRSGLDARFCKEAGVTELAALSRPKLVPGQKASDRKAAIAEAKIKAVKLKVICLWAALEALMSETTEASGKIWVDGPRTSDGQRELRIYQAKAIVPDIAGLPILHLDATLRLELAETVLPGLKVTIVEAAAEHQHVRLVSGGFGKSKLCQDLLAQPDENLRRANRLRECVDYVRWHALRKLPGRALVITYKAIESEFFGIPRVETAHFNAMAGLDQWADVAMMFIVGRPLPSSGDLHELTGAIVSQSVSGRYGSNSVSVWMRNGHGTSVRTLQHSDYAADNMRAAICDDEMIQALGRGRGVNRTANNPLEAHILADVALPVAHNRVQVWDAVRPDIIQRMLLGGLAVDSPADASRLHPGLFENAEVAKKAFQRAGFGGHFPIEDTYREMSLKSASYRLGGRGRGWRRATWITGTADEAKSRLEAAIGPLAEWKPD